MGRDCLTTLCSVFRCLVLFFCSFLIFCTETAYLSRPNTVLDNLLNNGFVKIAAMLGK